MERRFPLTVPTQVALLGATGDLVRKKLLKSFMNLFTRGLLPERFHLIGFARDPYTDETYRAFVREILAPTHRNTPTLVEEFLTHLGYVCGDFNDHESFVRLKLGLMEYDTRIGMCTSKLFYLATPPSLYDTIFEQIAHTKLDLPCAEGDGWVRILVEKPFGSDLDTARRLEDKLSVLFTEKQIYRIDHYLAKDALRNILTFRFSNILFENQWNNAYAEAVYIRFFETIDVGTRGSFFDNVGALRDVGQNHMLQMLALVAMHRPPCLDSVGLRTERAHVLRSLCMPTHNDDTLIAKGQYAGYTGTTGVAPDSRTETYFALKTFLDNDAWAGVPWYLEHGKALDKTVSDITIRFRSAQNCVCGVQERHDHPNFLRFTIAPKQKITLRFWVRTPGTKYAIEPSDMIFEPQEHAQTGTGEVGEAYEEVLFDALCGDQTLFVSGAEQTAAWEYVTHILEKWHDKKPDRYTKGSNGPASPIRTEIDRLFTMSHTLLS